MTCGLLVRVGRQLGTLRLLRRRTNGDQLADLGELADNGQLRPTIDQVFPLADARKAFARSLRHNRRGKIVLLVADET